MRIRLWVSVVFALCGALTETGVRAQTAESLASVKRVAVDWPETEKGSAAVRDRVLQKLKANSSVAQTDKPTGDEENQRITTTGAIRVRNAEHTFKQGRHRL